MKRGVSGWVYARLVDSFREVTSWLERITPHGLRHTAITRLIERGVPVPIVQRFAGHADIATTMRYCSLAEDVYAEQVRAALAA